MCAQLRSWARDLTGALVGVTGAAVGIASGVGSAVGSAVGVSVGAEVVAGVGAGVAQRTCQLVGLISEVRLISDRFLFYVKLPHRQCLIRVTSARTHGQRCDAGCRLSWNAVWTVSCEQCHLH